MWRKGNPSALLMEMQIAASAVENSVDIPQKLKKKLPMSQQFHLWEYIQSNPKH